jgi:hypothetical protein
MATKKNTGRPGTATARGKGPAKPKAQARGPAAAKRPGSLAGLLEGLDRVDALIDRLSGAGPAVAEGRRLLATRSADPDGGSPLSTAMLIRLVGPKGGADGLTAVIPFLIDASPWVQVAAGETIDESADRDLRAALLQLVRSDPDAPFWEPVVDLLEMRPEGVRLMGEILARVRRPEAQAALIEAMATCAAPKDVPRVKALLQGFLDDPRPVPGMESEDGPLTFSLLAAEAMDLLEGEA